MKPRIALPEPTSNDPAYNQRAWPQFAHAIESCGGVAVPIPLTESQATIARLISTCVGVLLPGSPADVNPQKYGEAPLPACAAPDPGREAVDELLLQDAFNLHKPLLGVCYGMQALNVWKNGSLIQDLETGVNHDPGRDVREAHAVAIQPGSRLAALLKTSNDLSSEPISDALEVNSSHHQSVRVVGDGLAASAISGADGVIEAVEGTSPGHFVVAVQWHPERTFGYSAASRALIHNFVEYARVWQPRVISESVVR
jgi:putative glutamine amidotransferase